MKLIRGPPLVHRTGFRVRLLGVQFLSELLCIDCFVRFIVHGHLFKNYNRPFSICHLRSCSFDFCLGQQKKEFQASHDKFKMGGLSRPFSNCHLIFTIVPFVSFEYTGKVVHGGCG